MRYKIKVYNIWEYGQRVDAAGNPHQEDSIYPAYNQATDDDRLFILCDGMGGHDSGEVASATVCEAMSNSIHNAVTDAEGDFSEAVLKQAIADAFSALDEKDSGATKKMGTTMTCLKLCNTGGYIAHMGDSRVYHIRPGKDATETEILFKTEDHSLVNDLIKAGELTEEEARNSRQKNVITRAMQPNMEHRPKADIHKTADIKPGDYFYLCSDGMLENMEDEQICYNFSDAVGDDEKKVQSLIKATKQNRDNHSAIIVHIIDVIDEPSGVSEIKEKSKNRKNKKGNIWFLAMIFSVMAIGAVVFVLPMVSSGDDENVREETPSKETLSKPEPKPQLKPKQQSQVKKENAAVVDTVKSKPAKDTVVTVPAIPTPALLGSGGDVEDDEVVSSDEQTVINVANEADKPSIPEKNE